MESRILPHDIETEESVMSAMLLYPESAQEAVELLKPSDFYRTSHGLIFEAFQVLVSKNIPIELPALLSVLKDSEQLESIGGATYLAKLMDTVPAATSMEFCAKKIKGKATLRETITIANKVIETAYEPGVNAETFLDQAQKDIVGIEYGDSSDSFSSFDDLMDTAAERYEELSASKGQLTGVPSGYYEIENMTCGFQKSDLILLAARPSMGKTALMLNFAWNMAESGKSCAVFSLEMSKNQLVDRMIAMESGVNSFKFRSGNFSKEDFARIIAAQDRCQDYQIHIDDTAGLSYLEMRRRVRRLSKQKQIDCILIDYVQLMRGDTKNGRVEEVSSISRNLKGMAKELDVPVIALSQLNRSLEMRTNKRPILSDLRDSGALEQDADMVMFIYRDEVYNKDENSSNKGIAEIDIAKQRTGPIGKVSLMWQKETTRFFNLQRGG